MQRYEAENFFLGVSISFLAAELIYVNIYNSFFFLPVLFDSVHVGICRYVLY